MSLTGLFLTLFLVVHLAGNLQLLYGDEGKAFNLYAKFMTSNPLIQTVSIGNFLFIILHVVQSILLTQKNRSARPVGYAYEANTSTWASRNMGVLGTVIFVFIVMHLSGFWFRMKIGDVPMTEYDGEQVKDLYTVVKTAFGQWWIVAFYVLSMAMLAFHLSHGFASAFQTLGFNHPKYSPVIKTLGLLLCIAVPVGFAAIPILMFLGVA
jgi:succinate dehydrogenase / fumarate reductase cytochrome b subunit